MRTEKKVVGADVPSADVALIESDSDAPEEESNVVLRKNVRAAEQQRQTEKSRSRAENRKRQTVNKQKDRLESTRVEEEEEAGPSSAQRLDPSLFAASFGQPAGVSSAKSNDAGANQLSHASRLLQSVEAQRKAKRKGGIVQGLDGRPMRRLDDGRTVVRVLQSPRTVLDDTEQREEGLKEEILSAPTTLSAAQALPSEKAARFKRQKLGLNEKKASATAKIAPPKRKAKTAGDPLGLEDPAFMKGGEFEHLGLSAVGTKKPVSAFKRTGRAAKGPSALRRGDAGRRIAGGTGRHAVPTNFARSQRS